MEKAGDAGDAVRAHFFICAIFLIFTHFFAEFCAFLHNFVVFLRFLHIFHIFGIFLQFFAHACVFLHAFFVLMFQAQKLCQCYFSRFFQLCWFWHLRQLKYILYEYHKNSNLKTYWPLSSSTITDWLTEQQRLG